MKNKNLSKKIDFSRPFLTRKWLLSLVSDEKFGLKFTPNLEKNKSYFGFSFSSNRFGLRGPDNVHSDTVIAGTSFTMGMAVDNGDNWYEYFGPNSDFFNIGFPVGHLHHINRLNEYYHGNGNKLIYIYHPNCWITAKNFFYANKKGVDIFEFSGWKTSLIETIILYLKYYPKLFIKKWTKRLIKINYLGKSYRLNTKYSYINLKKHSEFTAVELNHINNLFSRFSDIHVIRIPIKEQIAGKHINNEVLNRLLLNYEDNWKCFIEGLEHNIKLTDLIDKFTLEDYYPNDTHWNSQGNRKAFKYISSILQGNIDKLKK